LFHRGRRRVLNRREERDKRRLFWLLREGRAAHLLPALFLNGRRNRKGYLRFRQRHQFHERDLRRRNGSLKPRGNRDDADGA